MRKSKNQKRPTVAHVIKRYLGISETFIYRIVTHIPNYNCLVLTHGTQNLELFPFPNIYDAAAIKRHSWYWFRNHLDYIFSRNNTYFEYRSYFYNVLKKKKAKLLHTHFAPEGWKMLPIKKALNIPLITSFYGYDISRLPKNEIWHWRIKELFTAGDLFLVEGRHMAKKLKDLGCPEEKMRIHPIGIELDNLTFKERNINSNEEPIRILFCGRFVEKKGLKYALAAIETTIKKFPSIKFRIIGDGDNRKDMQELVQRMGLSQVVTFLGYCPHRELIHEMEQAHILLQPSITAQDGDSEGGAPVILLEAQAMGLPIVSTQHADIPNIVSDGESGFLVSERDQVALSNALSYLLFHPEKWPEMGRAGRKVVELNHNIADLTDKLEKYYTQLIYG